MKNIYLPYEAKITNIFTETEDKNVKTIDVELINEDDKKNFKFMPGQFVQFSLYSFGESPFGIASSPFEKEGLKFSINKTGVVTKRIHELEIGNKVGIRGPFGNYFPIEKFKGNNIVIVGGGFAFTTLRSLIQYCLDPRNRGDYNKIIILYGARTPGMLLYKELLKDWQKRDDIELHLTVDKKDEEWKEHEGVVPNVLKEIAPSSQKAYSIVCGPPIMIKYTLLALNELKFTKDKVFISLEMRMKCAVGKCGRCNIGSKYICKDGPIFSIDELSNLPDEY